MMSGFKFLSDEATGLALAESPTFADSTPPQPDTAFVNLVLAQAETQIPRDRIERGGLNVITTLDFDLQNQAACATEVYSARMAGLPEPKADCPSARLLPSLSARRDPRGFVRQRVDPRPENGQVLVLVGETVQGVETPLRDRPPAWVESRRLCLSDRIHPRLESSLLNLGHSQRFKHPKLRRRISRRMRLRTALANDYQVPVETLKTQMGIENVTNIESSFGLASARM